MPINLQLSITAYNVTHLEHFVYRKQQTVTFTVIMYFRTWFAYVYENRVYILNGFKYIVMVHTLLLDNIKLFTVDLIILFMIDVITLKYQYQFVNMWSFRMFIDQFLLTNSFQHLLITSLHN